MLTEIEQIIKTMSEILDRLGITYMIGGSVASGIHGIYRYTNDIDFVADIKLADVAALKEAFHEFYADEDMVREAIETQSSFSILHLQLMIKADVFIKANDDWTDEVWKRRQQIPISMDGSVKAYLPSPEDAILQKLRWFRMGGSVSDRQWSDILGMLKIRAGHLDHAYLRLWAAHLELSDLLEKAVESAL